MIAAVTVWKDLLDVLGKALAFLYDRVPGGYGIAIILLTIALRVLLLPLAVKQVRSMQAMNAIQPRVKQIQQKYKGNRSTEARQKMNEEMMALYKEHGVNPVSGCLPLVAQFPVLIALYGVLRFPVGLPHIPESSALFRAINVSHKAEFLGTNLLCSAQQAGRQDAEKVVNVYGRQYPTLPKGAKTVPLDCGNGPGSSIPYYVFAVLMIGTTYYQQRQMTRASPQANQQQQAITRLMPLLFGVWGYFFPAGLVVYWTTTNAIQIAQQAIMLPRIRAVQGETPRAGPGKPSRGTRSGGGETDGEVKPGRESRGSQTGARRGGAQVARRPAVPPRGRQGAASGGEKRSAHGSSATRGDRASGHGPKSSGGSGGGDRKKRRKR